MKRGAAGIQSSNRSVFLMALMWSAGLLALFVAATSISHITFDLLVAPANASLGDNMPEQIRFRSASQYFAMKLELGAFVTACVVLPLVVTKTGAYLLARKGAVEDKSSWLRMRYTPLLFVAGGLAVYLVGLPLLSESAATMVPSHSELPAGAISGVILDESWGQVLIDYVNDAMQTILIVGLGAQAAGAHVVYRKSIAGSQAGVSVE